MALTYSMQSQVPPAGAICFSGYMLRSVPYTNFMKFPILLAHGSRDPIIREVMAQQSYKKLLTDEGLVEYNSIEGLEHSVELGQLDMMKNWISETFKTIKGVYEK
jgi:predicted esterase